jgi:large-conductance mechanosensitive channel
MTRTVHKIGIILGSAVGAIVAAFAAWLTHIIVCLQAGKWAFLIAGALFPPVGIIHGMAVWCRLL